MVKLKDYFKPTLNFNANSMFITYPVSTTLDDPDLLIFSSRQLLKHVCKTIKLPLIRLDSSSAISVVQTTHRSL